MFDFSNVKQFKEQAGYMIGGKWYPRVTKILDIKSKPALYFFYGEAASYKAAKEITENSAKEGTLIHEIVEKFLIGEKPEIPETIRPAVNSFLNFIEEKNIHVDGEFVEKRIFHPGNPNAGIMNALALFKGKFGVLVFKTCKQ